MLGYYKFIVVANQTTVELPVVHIVTAYSEPWSILSINKLVIRKFLIIHIHP